MASRILLISSNRCADPYPVFPLGLAHVDTALRGAGHVTELFDCQSDPRTLEDVVGAFDPQYVGISCRNVDDVQYVKRETFFDHAVTVAHQVRACTAAPIVLGGSAFSLYPQRLLELSGAEFGVQGEGERAFPLLIAALENDGDYRGVPGLVYRSTAAGQHRKGAAIPVRDPPQQDRDAIVINPRQPLAADEIAAPDRSPQLVDYYLRRSSMLNLQTQRGCAFRCIYCTYPLIEGRLPRRRDPDLVADELTAMAAAGARHVFIADSVLNTSTDHVVRFCEAVLRRDVQIQWSCFLRPQGVTAELMGLMSRAGLTHVEFGGDSFCDEVLAAYGKGFTFDDIRQASEHARVARVHYSHFLICGGPGETAETLEITFKRSQQLASAVIFALAGMRIYPNTPLQERALREGVITTAADLLEPVYYISPALPAERLLEILASCGQRARNWIIGTLPPHFDQFAERMRQRGVVGPLWEYFGAMQALK